MKLCGLQGISVIDFPGHIASVLFLGGCNFRCPFCHNAELVLHPDAQPDISVEDALRTIAQRKALVDSVVVTGGEPLVSGAALRDLLRRLREAGLKVKLDTNGYEVEALQEVLGAGLVDYVAMDVKTSLERYGEAAGRTVDAQRIQSSVAAIAASGVAHEFRTTCVPGLVGREEVRAIATLLGGKEHYVLQQYRAAHGVLDPAYADITPYPPAVVRSLAEEAAPLVGSTAVRGV